MTASDVLDLLMTKHAKDVCIPECKTGPTWGNKRMLKIDLWTMNRSWTNSQIIAYEIKVSRSDFLNDDKWRGYLPFCNAFYFAAPYGVIKPEELPAEAGLIVASKTGTMMRRVKKAPPRSVDISQDIFMYILMSRVKITREHADHNKREYWDQWLKEKDEKKRIGHNVSRKIRELVEKRINAVETTNRNLKSENDNLQDIKKMLLELGVKEYQLNGYPGNLRYRVNELINAVPEDLERSLRSTISRASETLELLNSYNGVNHE